METPEQNNYAKGIDVSKHQGKIDWNEVIKDAIKYVFIKMTEGATYQDEKFVTNWKDAKKMGINVGAYHYFKGASSTPEAQAENIRKNLASIEFDPAKNLLAIDVEEPRNESVSPDRMADNLQDLLTRIKSDVLPNVEVIIYCSPEYWDHKVAWKKYDFSIYPLWVAHWGASQPRLPKSWETPGNRWSWWQYSSEGNVQGIKGEVDMNWVNTSDREQFCGVCKSL